jgi:hypothetical protein
MNLVYFVLCTGSVVSAELGIDWAVLGVVLLGVTALMILIRVVGLFAASSIADTVTLSLAHEVQKRSAPLTHGEGEITPELVAVLTAAATMVLGTPIRICSISTGNIAAQRSWSQEGRREIYMSHRIR